MKYKIHDELICPDCLVYMLTEDREFWAGSRVIVSDDVAHVYNVALVDESACSYDHE